jgi:hypothetical protein
MAARVFPYDDAHRQGTSGQTSSGMVGFLRDFCVQCWWAFCPVHTSCVPTETDLLCHRVCREKVTTPARLQRWSITPHCAQCMHSADIWFCQVDHTVTVTVTVTVTGYLFSPCILKENEQPIPTLFRPASQRRPHRGHWHQRPGASLLAPKPLSPSTPANPARH